MTRYRNWFLIFSLLLLTLLTWGPASASNPFESKTPLELSETSSIKAGDTADKNARIQADADDTKAVTVAVMADLHARPENLPMLQRAIKRVNAFEDLFALAIVGDLCSKLGTSDEYNHLRRGLKDLSVPAYAVPGNHDILYQDNLVNGEKKRGTPAEKKAKQALFKKTLNLKSLYYAKKIGGHLLIFLPNDTLRGIPCVLPSDEAFDFLRKTLRENRNMPTIIFCHAPLAGSYGDKKTMPPLQANAQPARKIHKILAENPQVFLWFAGHLHITPSQKYFNSSENKIGKVTVIHVPPLQVHTSWVQTLRLSPKGAVVRTMDVRTGKYLKKHTRVFKHSINKDANDPRKESEEKPNKDNDQDNGKGFKKSRIVVVNAHAGGNKNRPAFGNWLADQEPDLALVSEAVAMSPHLRDTGRVFNAGSAARGRQEVAIVVRDGLQVAAHHQGRVSPDLGIGIAHDRWWSRVQTRVAGIKARVYSLHLNAVIQQRDGHPLPSNRWDVTRTGLSELEKQLCQDIKDGWAVIVGGDLNWCDSRTNARSHRMSPGQMFKRIGLTFINRELMWLAWTPGTHKSVKRVIIPPTNIPGLFAGEHPALCIDLQARKQSEDNEPDPEESKHDTSDEEVSDEDTDEPAAEESELESDTCSDDELLDNTEDSSSPEPESVAKEPEDPSEEKEEELAEPESSDETVSETTTNEPSLEADDGSEKSSEDVSTNDSENEALDDAEKAAEDGSDEAAIERIRELVAELYEYLEKLFANFTSLLRS